MSTMPKGVHKHLLHRPKLTGRGVAGTAQLTYFIFEGVLTGLIGRELIHIIAWSGGAGGSKNENSPERDVVNSPYQYARKQVDTTVVIAGKERKIHIHGGPIPPGAYEILPPDYHKHFNHVVAFLRPLQALPNGRGGFFIHKRGPHGSDGCIVPATESYDELIAKLKMSRGGTLHVLQSMDGVFV